MGRYYAMDRDKRWDRVQRAYDAIALGAGRSMRRTPPPAVQKSYDAGVTDEFMEPVVCAKGAQVRDNDSIIFYNFRPDRAREITRCFVDEDFQDVERKKGFVPVDLCLYHRVRRHHAQCDGGLPPAEAGEHLWRVYQPSWG